MLVKSAASRIASIGFVNTASCAHGHGATMTIQAITTTSVTSPSVDPKVGDGARGDADLAIEQEPPGEAAGEQGREQRKRSRTNRERQPHRDTGHERVPAPRRRRGE